MVKGGFTRRIYAITCRSLTVSQLSNGFKETLEQRLPKEFSDQIEPLCDKVRDVPSGEIIDQIFTSDNSVTIKFAKNESNSYSKEVGTAILNSAFDKNPLGLSLSLSLPPPPSLSLSLFPCVCVRAYLSPSLSLYLLTFFQTLSLYL